MFPECSAAGCQKIRDVQEIGEDKAEYKRLIDIDREIRDKTIIRSKAGTIQEKAFLLREIDLLNKEADSIRKQLDIKRKTQVSLF